MTNACAFPCQKILKKHSDDEEIALILKDIENNEVKRWNFFRAFPCRWIGPRLETNLGSDYAVERIEITHEGLALDSN